MAVALSSVAMHTPGRLVTRVIKVTVSGTTYTAGGDTLDFTGITNAAGIDGFKQFSRLPVYVVPMNDVNGYYFEIIPGTTLANWKFKVFAPAGTEAANGGAAYTAINTGTHADILIEMVHKQGQ